MALFALLATLPGERRRVWDCATGSGQAALGLARYFEAVLATDASAAQVRAAESHPRVRYAVAQAEGAPFRSGAFDLITVAQALHWLELPEFYAEARRLLAPGGVVAVWTYGRHHVDGGAAVDEVLDDYYDRIVGPYWPPERRWVETGYRTLRFPFAEVPVVAPPDGGKLDPGRDAGLHRHLVRHRPLPHRHRGGSDAGPRRPARPAVGRSRRPSAYRVAAQRPGGPLKESNHAARLRRGCSGPGPARPRA